MNKKKPLVVHVITTLNMGGAENMLKRIVNGSQAFDHLIVCLKAINTNSILKDISAPVIELNMDRTFFWFISFFKVLVMVIKRKPLAIMGWMYHGMFIAAFLCLFTRAKLIFNFRQTLYNINNETKATRIIILFCKKISSFADVCIYNSKMGQNQHQEFGFSKNNSVIIPNGFSIEEYRYLPTLKNELSSKLNIGANAIIFGMIARYHRMKGYPLFIKAMQEIIAEHPDKEIHVLMAGKNINNSNLELMGLITNDSAAPKFHLMGQIENSNKLLSALDCLCMTSHWGEGFPNILGEAILSNVFCISSNVGDGGLLVDKEFVFKNYDLADFKDKLNKYLKLDSAQKQQIIYNLRQRFESDFEIKKIISSYEDLIKKITA